MTIGRDAGRNTPPSLADRDRGGRILLVEDERHLCMTLGDRLRDEGYLVVAAHDGKIGFERALAMPFDLIILDVTLPIQSGIDVCVQLRKVGVTAPILFLTARSQTIQKLAGFQAGADDYVTKPFDTTELVARVQALLRRASAERFRSTPAEENRFGPIALDPLRMKAVVNGQDVTLTSREFQLLRYLAENSGRTVSRDEILEKVWGNLGGKFTRTVDMHVASLRHKLESNPRQPEVILTVPGIGYRFKA